jgi:hypothetical protein
MDKTRRKSVTPSPPPDIYSLKAWCEEQALEAHNRAAISGSMMTEEEKEKSPYPDYLFANESGVERAFNEMVSKMNAMGINQRPHIGGKRV